METRRSVESLVAGTRRGDAMMVVFRVPGALTLSMACHYQNDE